MKGTETLSQPASTAPETRFFNALKEGRFELQFCSETGRPVYYPRTISPFSGEPLTEWREVSGLGTVYSTTTARRRPEQGGDYNIILVDLEEGARMMSEVRGIPSLSVRIGMRVKAAIEENEKGEPLVVFRPLEEEAR